MERRLFEAKESKWVFESYFSLKFYKNAGTAMRQMWIMFVFRRLLEKSQRIEAILASLQASGAEPEQLTEVEEMITAPEKQQLDSLRLHVNK